MEGWRDTNVPAADRSEATGPDPSERPDPVPLDPVRLRAYQRQLEDEQHFAAGALAGLFAAVVCAALWTTVTVATGFLFGWLAVIVGLIVAFAVRMAGRGLSLPFAVLGAGLAVAACLLGNLGAVYAAGLRETDLPLATLFDLVGPGEALRGTFETFDLVFYGIAAYEGFALSRRTIADHDLISAAG